MIRVLELRIEGGQPKVTELKGDAARAACAAPPPGSGIMRWVDVSEQTQADIDLLAQGFRFHPLALEDCLHFDQRPKLEEYAGAGSYLFVVTHNFAVLPTPSRALDGENSHSMHMPRVLWAECRTRRIAVTVLETHAFIGQGFLVTVHDQVSPALAGAWQKVMHDPQLMSRGTDFVYYLMADLLCDANFPVLEQLGEVLDEMEEAIFDQPSRLDLHRIYSLRKTLVAMRRVLSPQRDVMGNLSRHGGSTLIGDRTAPYFRDIYDHLTRIYESIEAGRDLLSSCVDAYMSAVAQRTNEIMKQLTLLSSLLLPVTFLSGLFGMNFEMMPFKSRPAFIAALVLMFVVVPGTLFVWFRKKGWLGGDRSASAEGKESR